VQPSECIVIEDATNGVGAAHAAGMPVIAMTTTLTREQLSQVHPTYIVDSYVEARDIVASLL